MVTTQSICRKFHPALWMRSVLVLDHNEWRLRRLGDLSLTSIALLWLTSRAERLTGRLRDCGFVGGPREGFPRMICLAGMPRSGESCSSSLELRAIQWNAPERIRRLCRQLRSSYRPRILKASFRYPRNLLNCKQRLQIAVSNSVVTNFCTLISRVGQPE